MEQHLSRRVVAYASLFAASQQPIAIIAVATRTSVVSLSPSSKNDRTAPMKGGRGVVGAGAGGVIERLSCGWGWRYVWHLDTDPRNEFHFECTECLYRHIFERRGVLERFGPMFCHADIINYGSLPYTDFIRTRTLCHGGDRCDFRFVRHRKGEQWQRSRSLFKMGDND